MAVGAGRGQKRRAGKCVRGSHGALEVEAAAVDFRLRLACQGSGRLGQGFERFRRGEIDDVQGGIKREPNVDPRAVFLR